MAQLTIQDLRAILAECAGEDESVDLGGDILDREFHELGYDSLALLETAGRIKERFETTPSAEEIAELSTPRAVLELVNLSQPATI